ncbi:MAG TPA: hypothetical protein VFR03_19995 [Thermoanaerobaculia bacterium]|nr:hypothetical protein [Thermoanaerobaculia bacterium]
MESHEVTLEYRVSQLERHNRQLRMAFSGMLLLALSLGAAGLAGAGQTEAKPGGAAPRVAKFDEITVGRINVAGPDGINRIILSYKMPQGPFQGEMLTRSVPPGMAGIIYCAPNGDEVGGIGVSGTEKGGHALITLDYRNTPLEAIGFATHYGAKGQNAGLVVMDSPTGTVDVKKLKAADEAEIKRLQAMMVERVTLGVDGHNAALVFKDRNGKDRIVIGVDESNTPELKVLDENGKEVGRLPVK